MEKIVKIKKIKKLDNTNTNTNTNTNKIIKIKVNNDIELNGRIYFVPDKYIGNAISYLSIEHRYLYKIIFALYLDSLITNNKIENISRITKIHINDAILHSDKLISYIISGKTYIVNLSIIEKLILDKVPEYLLQKINPNIIEKIDL